MVIRKYGLIPVPSFLLPSSKRRDFPRAKPKGNPEEQPCQPEENPVHPDSFTWIYILRKIGHFGDISDFKKILTFEEA